MINLEMPENVQSYVRVKQGEYKANRHNGSYSLQSTICSIIMEHKALTASIENKVMQPPEENIEPD